MIRQKLIQAGVKNLKEFGYPKVDKDNILIDEVYKRFFLAMLKDNLGYTDEIDTEIDKLIKEIE